MSKKVQFGIKDLTIWKLTETVTTTGTTIAYGDATSIPGTTKMDLSPNGSDPSTFYADDSSYWVTAGKSSGYTGSFDNALIADAVKTTFMNYVTDANNNVVELADNETVFFAMAFAKETNDGDVRYLFPKCTFGRLSVKGDTTTDSITPEVENAPITVLPSTLEYTLGGKKGHVCSVKSSDTTTTASFEAWFTTPQLPAESNG